MNGRKAAALLALLVVLGLAWATANTSSLSGGIGRSGTPMQLPAEGCTCHGPNGAGGVPNANVKPLFRLEPNLPVYAPGQTYNLTVGANETDVAAEVGSNQGGFNLKVTVGTLAAAPGDEKFVQVLSPTEATHTADGDKRGRTFNLTWTAPGGVQGPAVFTLYVNTVNGDTTPSDADHWNGLTYVLLDKAGASLGAGADHPDPEKIGVNWLAHWVGIISFVAVVGTLLIYYFVLKFGESVHTTDHRDRKEK